MKASNLLPLKAVALLALAAAAGCTTPAAHTCKLEPEAVGKCASVEEAYAASQNYVPGKSPTVFNSQKPTGAPAAATQKQPFFQGTPSEMPSPGQTGMPVFQQPKVMRVWVAPYVDADGNLRTGEYTYFSTPGQWNYGASKTPGAASSATFGPVKPGQLGFAPTAPAVKTPTPSLFTGQQPPKPTGSATPRPATPTPSVPASGPRGITQPYQRLTTD